MIAQPVLAASVKPGDPITEVHTPSGPWYLVLSVEKALLTLDARLEATDRPVPVTLPVRAHDVVLRRRPC